MSVHDLIADTIREEFLIKIKNTTSISEVADATLHVMNAIDYDTRDAEPVDSDDERLELLTDFAQRLKVLRGITDDDIRFTEYRHTMGGGIYVSAVHTPTAARGDSGRCKTVLEAKETALKDMWAKLAASRCASCGNFGGAHYRECEARK